MLRMPGVDVRSDKRRHQPFTNLLRRTRDLVSVVFDDASSADDVLQARSKFVDASAECRDILRDLRSYLP